MIAEIAGYLAATATTGANMAAVTVFHFLNSPIRVPTFFT
jgi:hypothetical protein